MALTDTFYPVDSKSRSTTSTTEQNLLTNILMTKTSTPGYVTYVRVKFDATFISGGDPGAGATVDFYIESDIIGSVNIGTIAIDSSEPQVATYLINGYANSQYKCSLKMKVNNVGDKITINNLMMQTYKE